ncbi:MAG: hypothetical protein JST38_14255 [Bacteroidetes bacterium]|nr:hypothetical protein [Bacteroidota bacterium]MBS1942031.1 hypothetical protein [Bacteroidota bacterium]
MFDQILANLEKEAAPALMSKLGLNQQQASGSVQAAASSVTDVLGGGDGFGMDDVLNLFSNAKNTSGADGILSKVGDALHGKLTNQVGLNAGQAGSVKDMILPMITNLISQHVGGDGNKLSGLLQGLGGNSGGLAGAAKGLLGKLFN